MNPNFHGTHLAPIVSADRFKRTKIIATIGPATDSYDLVLEMIKAGANGIRMNFSHATYEEAEHRIKWIRKASKEYSKPVAIIQDLQGPKLRLGDFDGVIPVSPRKILKFSFKADYEAESIIPTQIDLSKKVKKGDRMFLVDGRVQCLVKSVDDKVIIVEAQNEGVLTKRKGINLPDTDFAGDVITAKDKRDVAFACNSDFDYIALSFVQSAKDVQKLRRIIDSHNSPIKIIAKIETAYGVENIEEIVEASDAVMIARGDLAIETSIESVPVITRKIINLCREQGKPSIIATEVLRSMVESSHPTRAEMSDIATAVIVGTDCLMLSDETAVGKHPIEAVKVMKKGILYTQTNLPPEPTLFNLEDKTIDGAVASAVVTLTHQVGAKAIVAETKTGKTARELSAHRPNMPIIMITPSSRVAQQLAIVYGGKVFVRPEHKYASKELTQWLHGKNVFQSKDIVVSASGRTGQAGATDTIKVYELP